MKFWPTFSEHTKNKERERCHNSLHFQYSVHWFRGTARKTGFRSQTGGLTRCALWWRCWYCSGRLRSDEPPDATSQSLFLSTSPWEQRHVGLNTRRQKATIVLLPSLLVLNCANKRWCERVYVCNTLLGWSLTPGVAAWSAPPVWWRQLPLQRRSPPPAGSSSSSRRQVEAIRNSFNVYFNVIVKSVTYTKSNGGLCTTVIPTHLVVQVYNLPLQTLTSFWQVKAPVFA